MGDHDARDTEAVSPAEASPAGFWRGLFDRVVRPILTANDTPHALALGASMGLFVSLTPTVGIQMTVVVVLGTLIRANRIVAVAMTWISNPVTLVPMYYGYYRFGLVLLGRPGVSYERLEQLMTTGAERSAWRVIVDAFNELGVPLWIGSLVIAAAIAIPTYPVTRRWLEAKEKRREGEARMPRPNSIELPS